MADLILTKHFTERWMERVGNWPTVDGITHFIRQSVKVQKGDDVIRNGAPFRMLAIYWHPELELVIKVDEERSTAVTVLSRENWRKQRLSDVNLILTGGYAGAAKNNTSSKMARRIAGIRAMFGRRETNHD